MASTVKIKPAATRRNKQYEKRLRSILKAASKIIARDGFEGASIRKVAASAGIGLSGIYYYFKSKDELLYALQDHTFTSLVETLRQRLKTAHSKEDKLRAVIENHFRFFVNNMNDLKVCVHEIESLSGNYYKKILKIRREYYRLVRSIVAEITGKSRAYDIDLATLFLFGSLNWIYMWYKPEMNSDIVKIQDKFLNIFLNGINAL